MENYTEREVDEYGNIEYFNSKKQNHRLDGPAIEYTRGSKYWYVNGKRHRLDGPAAIWQNGEMNLWWINDNVYLKSCHNRLYLFSILEPQRIDLSPTEDD